MKFNAFTNNIPLFYVFIRTIAIVNRSTYYIQRNRIADNICRVFINYCVFLLNVAILHNSAKPDGGDPLAGRRGGVRIDTEVNTASGQGPKFVYISKKKRGYRRGQMDQYLQR